MMTDISNLLDEIMTDNKCTSIYALLMLAEENDVSILQPQPIKQINRRLCYSGNHKTDKTRLG